VEFDGRISPVEQVSLHFKTSGYVKQIHAKQGDRVQAGDLLAELETADLPNQIAQAEAALSSAQLALSNAERAREQELALAKLNLSVAQTKLKQAEDANAYAITQAGLSLELAREHVASAQALQATYAAEVVRARIGLEQAKDQVERAQIEYQKSVQ
jgi:multidrug efflux pump subunit AcrA (membrane-fusion protein)